jgi:hypothetical protein
MVGLLYFLSVIIALHCGLMLLALARMGRGSRNWYSSILGLAMIGTTFTAMWLGSWSVLALGFAVYRLLLMVETLIITWNRSRTPLILPVNFLMIAGAIVAYCTGVWLIFVVSYCLYWAFSYLAARYDASRHFS